MSTLSYAVADSATMLRRQLRHIQRYVSITVFLIGISGCTRNTKIRP